VFAAFTAAPLRLARDRVTLPLTGATPFTLETIVLSCHEAVPSALVHDRILPTAAFKEIFGVEVIVKMSVLALPIVTSLVKLAVPSNCLFPVIV